jgi:iron complex outermembrane recepter protein
MRGITQLSAATIGVTFSLVFVMALQASAQSLSGTVTDADTKEPLFGTSVVIEGTAVGATTDFDGKFKFTVDRQPPFKVIVSYIGYKKTEVTVTSLGTPLVVALETDRVMLKGVEIVDTRISEKQKESALTVESMDIIAIKETPAANFYDGLGNLKGVDLTSASIGFKVINTRGFNSTSPVRSLQVIDGVDNQSPGLNFSLGNFLGASELDVMKVDIVQGASSAFYGPNAFNGVIDMRTRSPFIKPGLTAQIKVGERRLSETAIRWAQVFKNKAGEDKFAYKLNLFYMQAYDWEADNMNPVDGSPVPASNPGGYDAVNRYGDEDLAGGNIFTQPASIRSYPGLGIYYRRGYEEKDLVDYNSRNLKANLAMHYRIKPDVEAIVSSSFSYGTTVYQGENRFSLKDILFFQNRIEFRKEGKWFVRAYATNEDAGNSYDAVLTAFKMLNNNRSLEDYYRQYSNYWGTFINPKVRNLPGYPQFVFGQVTSIDSINGVLSTYNDSIVLWHQQATYAAENSIMGGKPYAQPGTQEYTDLFNAYTSRIYTDTSIVGGGTKFYDKSALYHVHGEYKITPSVKETELGEFTFGGNVRLYTPDSRGTIFSDTADRVITNWEFGVYVGWDRKFFKEKLKASIAARLDKNENFPFLVSPAASLVYMPDRKHTLRLSFSSAIRNPTLADQFLYYDVGRAILIGNTSGYTDLITLESFVNYVRGSQNPDTLVYYDMPPVVPEKVQTGEIGYRGFLFNKLSVDASYYVSYYTDFIGYKVGVKSGFASLTGFPVNTQVYRIATNSENNVITQGFSIGLNYYFQNKYGVSANYSWNRLDRLGVEDDPVIPAFNTPEHKFNVGITGRDIEVISPKNGWIGFGLNYKWIQGFVFEGSPQFTGAIPSYDMFDAQISYTIPSKHITFKVGASNLFGIQPLFGEGDFAERMERAFDNRNYQVYGGPAIGRLGYFSVLFEWN